MAKKVFLLLCLLFICPCSAVSQQEAEQQAVNGCEAENMFYQALEVLPSGEGGIAEAREALREITRLYPHSRWQKPAESILWLIDQHESCALERAENKKRCDFIVEKSSQCQGMENRCKDELARVLVEKEQLKRDLERIKDLEIELGRKNLMK